jgi:phenylalanyl-tRNA synthetase beta chain
VGRPALAKRSALGEEEAVLWMKGAVEELVARLHSGKLEFAAADHPAFAKGAALSVVLNGRPIGIMGALSAAMRHPYRLTTQMVLCELELKPLVKRIDAVGRVSAPPVFPSTVRDIALVAEKGVTHEAIVKTVRKNAGRELVKVELFDIFKSKDLKDGRRSLAYSLEFRSAEKTLTDDEVSRSFLRVVEALKALPGVEVREA